jgi:hypothetical protein
LAGIERMTRSSARLKRQRSATDQSVIQAPPLAFFLGNDRSQ